MATDLTQFKKPSWMTPDEEILTDKGAISVPRINLAANGDIIYKDGVATENWGQDVDFVILKMFPGKPFHNFRSYWDTTYDPDNSEPPVCTSNDGKRPNSWSAKMQAETCDQCPQNVAGTGGTEKARACQSTKQLLLVRADNVKGQPFILQIPVTAIKGVYRYINDIVTTLQVSESCVKTRIVPDSEVTRYIRPKLVCYGYLDNKADVEYCLEKRKELTEHEDEYISQQTTVLSIENNSVAEQANSVMITPEHPDGWSQATTTLPDNNDLTDLLSEEIETDCYSAVLNAMKQQKSLDDLKKYMNSKDFRETFAKCDPQQKEHLKTAVKNLAETFKTAKPDPIKQVQDLFQSITKKEQLVELLEKIRDLDDKEAVKGFKNAFIRTGPTARSRGMSQKR